MALAIRGNAFSKVLNILTLCSKYTRARDFMVMPFIVLAETIK
jgi:hypothetical protein